jgi:hypothetical protein
MRADNVTRFRRGSELPQAKMTEEDVRRAREEYIKGRQKLAELQRYYSVEGLAERYGISKPAMEKILYRQTWEHVK